MPTMSEIDAILSLIDDNADLTEIRLRIADEIIRQLRGKRHALGYWEIAHFTNAIGSLSINLNAPAQPTAAWLKTCVIDLEKAMLPPDARDDAYIPRARTAEPLNYEQLMQAIQTVRHNILRHSTANAR